MLGDRTAGFDSTFGDFYPERASNAGRGDVPGLEKKKRPTASKWYGKVATILFYFSFVVIVAMKGFFQVENLAVTITLLSVTAAFMIYAFIQYVKIFLQLLHSTDPKDEIDLKADIRAKKPAKKQ